LPLIIGNRVRVILRKTRASAAASKNVNTPLRRVRPKLLRNAKAVLIQASLAWIEHDASTMGASLAFYTVFSVAPILLIAIGIVGWVIGADAVRADLLPQMQSLLGDAGASAVQTLLSSASYMGRSRSATAIGVATVLLGASSVFVELQTSLDRIWGIPKRNRKRGLWRFVRSRFLSLGLVFGVGFLMMVSLLVSTALAAVGVWLASHFGEWKASIVAVDVALSLIISTALFALVYKYVPQERLHWRDVWVGGAVTAILFNIGKFAIGYYLAKSTFAAVYGAAGSLLVLLLWAYYSAQIFLFGAEVTKSYSLILGTRICARPTSAGPADSQQVPTSAR
jgi:membrane protein